MVCTIRCRNDSHAIVGYACGAYINSNMQMYRRSCSLMLLFIKSENRSILWLFFQFTSFEIAAKIGIPSANIGSSTHYSWPIPFYERFVVH